MRRSKRSSDRLRWACLALLTVAITTGGGGSTLAAQRPAPPIPIKPPPAPAPAPPPGSAAAPIAVFGVKRFGVATPVTGTLPSIAVIELNGRAPPGGVTIQLSSSNPAIVTVPPSLVIPAGMSGEKVELTTFAVSLPTEVTITAVPKGGPPAPGVTLTVVPPALERVACGSATITAGTTATCSVSLNGPVAAGPAAIEPAISLTSDPPTLGAVPAQVSVRQGAKVASFALKATPSAQSAPLVISAAYAGVTKRLALTLTPAPLRSLRLSVAPSSGPGAYNQPFPQGGVWGWPIRVAIDLTAPAPAGGMVIQLTSDQPQLADLPQLLQPPPAVRIAAGQASDTFYLPTRSAPLGTAVSVMASVPQVGQTLVAVWKPSTHPIRGLYVSGNGELNLRETPRGSVFLRGRAPPGGIEVRLTSSNPAVVLVPDAIRIPEGETQGEYRVRVAPLGPYDSPVRLGATVPGSENVVSLETVVPGSVLYDISAPSVVDSVPFGGTTVTATVRIRHGAPAGGASVSLSYNGGTFLSGPGVVTVAPMEREKPFQIKLSPCSVNPPCTVTITGIYGDTKVATLVVKP